MRLAIVGSREFVNQDWWMVAGIIIEKAIAFLEPTEIVSGGAAGIDTLAETHANDHGIPLKVYLPAVQTWDGTDDAPGFMQRNMQIAKRVADGALLSIRDSESTSYGSGWTADRAEELGARVFRRLIRPDDVPLCECGFALWDVYHPDWHKIWSWNKAMFEDAEAKRRAAFDQRLADAERRQAKANQ